MLAQPEGALACVEGGLPLVRGALALVGEELPGVGLPLPPVGEPGPVGGDPITFVEHQPIICPGSGAVKENGRTPPPPSMARMADSAGDTTLESLLMQRSLSDPELMAASDAAPDCAILPEASVLRIGGQSLIDRGRAAVYPVVEELVQVRRHTSVGAAVAGQNARMLGYCVRRYNIIVRFGGYEDQFPGSRLAGLEAMLGTLPSWSWGHEGRGRHGGSPRGAATGGPGTGARLPAA